MKGHWRLLALALILALGFLLRIYALGEHSLWYDEGGSVFMARQDLTSLLRSTALDVHPPFYLLLLHFWLPLVGESEFSVRFLSLLFGMLSLPLLYKLGQRLLGIGPALWGTFLAAFSPFLVYYSQETRMYSLLTFLSLLSSYFLLRALARGAARLWLVYLAATVLTIYTHYYGLLIPLFQSGYLLLAGLQGWSFDKLRAALSFRGSLLYRWLVVQACLLLLFLPWLGTALNRYTVYTSPSRGTPLVSILRDTMTTFALGHSVEAYNAVPGDPSYDSDRGRALWLGSVFLLLATIGLSYQKRASSPLKEPLSGRWPVLFLSVYLVVPIVSLYFLSRGRSDYTPRYLIAISPAYYLLAAAGLHVLQGGSALRARRVLFASCLLLMLAALGYSLGNYYFDPKYSRDDHRSAAGYLEEHINAQDGIILNAPYFYPVFTYYYKGPSPWIGLPQDYPPLESRVKAALEELASRYDRLWLVLWQDYYSDPQGFVENWLKENAALLETKSFHGKIRVELFAIKSQD